jgi:hypothetical protein
MAHFLVVGRPNDGAKGLGSVTAFNMERVQGLFLQVGDSTMSVTVNDVLEPEELPEYFLVDRYLTCHESTVLIEMQSMTARMEVEAKKAAAQ